mgnify:CR=1 FL=1
MLVIDKYVQRLIAIWPITTSILEKGRVAWRGSSADLGGRSAALWHRYLGV